MARTRLALESGVANETSRLRRGNRQKNSLCRPWKRLFYWGLWNLKWIRFFTNIITVPTIGVIRTYIALGFVAPKISLGFVERTHKHSITSSTCTSIHITIVASYCSAIYTFHCVTIKTHLKVLIKYCNYFSTGW